MKNQHLANLTRGLWKENPTLVLVLGMCPTLAVTTSAYNGLGMGLATLCVLIGSNLVISALRNFIPKRVRIPAYIVIIATFVTVIQMLLAAYLPALNTALGIFIPLIVVNCIILGRAEAFASKNGMFDSLLDAIGMGLGFTGALFVLGSIREIIGNGSWTLFQYGDYTVGFTLPAGYEPTIAMILPPGGFLTLGLVLALLNWLKEKKDKMA